MSGRAVTIRITNELVADLFVAIFEKQSDMYGGETTLNELRVIAACYQAHTYGRTTSVTSLSKSLNMPTSTTHRAVTSMIERGWLVDSRHPSDGRKRVIGLSKRGVTGGLWQKIAEFVYQHPSNNDLPEPLAADEPAPEALSSRTTA